MSKKPLMVIFITVFVDLIGFGIIIPLAPYIAREFGATASQVGLLFGCYSAMQFLCSPFWGQLSDRMGRRPVLLLSILGTALAHFAFFKANSLWMLFLARIFAGIFSANISTANAYIADITEAKDRSKSMGLIGAAFGLGFILGPAIGGFTASIDHKLPFLIAAGISLVNFMSAFFILKESLPIEKRKVREKKSRLKKIYEKIKLPVVSNLLFGQFAAVLAMANMESVLPLFVFDRFGWNERQASYGFAYVGVCIAFTQGFLVRRLIRSRGERKLLFYGFIFFAIGLFLLGLSQWIWLLAIAMTLLALGNGFIGPSLTGGISLLTSEAEQGEVIGVNHSLAALARVIGPVMGGSLYQHLGIAAPFWAAGTIALFGLFLISNVLKQIPNHGKSSS